jgi:hypothetical protein
VSCASLNSTRTRWFARWTGTSASFARTGTRRFRCFRRSRLDVALGAGGAYLGHEISNGDPLITAAGAAGGVVVSETLHYAAKKQSEKAFATGYDKGKSDAVKQQYWLYVSMQKQRNQVGSVRLYPAQLPEQRIDGVTFRLRIEE